MDHSPPWLTVGEVHDCQTLEKVNMNDEVAIYHEGDEDWTIGIVVDIGTYADRSTRFIKKRTVTIKPHDHSIGRNKVFYEMRVEQVLFKEKEK